MGEGNAGKRPKRKEYVETLEADQRNRLGGVTLWPSGLAPDMNTVVPRSPLGEALGHERLSLNLELAVDKHGARQETSVAVDTTGRRTG